MTIQTTHKPQSLENDPKTKCWTSHCSLSRIFGRQFVKSNPEPGHDTRLMNYTQLSYGPELGWRYQRASWNNRHESGASRYCGIVQHCMLRGVKTSTWSPQLLFVRHTHNNLLSIPTSTNHIQSNVAFYLQGVLEQEEALLQNGAIGILWKPTQIFSAPQLVRKCLTATQNIGGFQLVRGSVWSPLFCGIAPNSWNWEERILSQCQYQRELTGGRSGCANKVGFYVGGHYVNIFIGVLPEREV